MIHPMLQGQREEDSVNNAITVLLSLWNWYRRYELGDAAVVPIGLLISFGVVLILIYTGWRGWELVYKHRVAIADQQR
jgi:uncharacterized membrane protein